MAILPLPPIGLGPEFQPPSLDDATRGTAPSSDAGGGFGAMLEDALSKLSDLQTNAASQSQDLATGQAKDIDSVVLAVEQASLGLEVASQVRNKAVEAYQDIFRMQV
jgi:flagellar hook-basal body complex protein FliE